MKIKLHYPVFVFTKNDPMVYVYYDDGQLKTTFLEYIKKTNFKNDIFIDSSGMKYFPQSAYVTHIWGFWERTLRKLWRLGTVKLITIDYEYKDAGSPITMENLKEMIMQHYPRSKWFHSAWSDVEEFKEKLDRCTTYEQIAQILGGSSPPKNRFLRILRSE